MYLFDDHSVPACGSEPAHVDKEAQQRNGLVSLRKPSSRDIRIKRAIDIVGALSFFIAFFWLFACVWLAVVLTTGSPAFYGHIRIGQGGREFRCWKFRSMVPNSDEILRKHLASDAAVRAEWNEFFKLRNDPRITSFGKFIRRSCLDELPQFWNVLRGEMSLVGPRPVTRMEIETYYEDAADHYIAVRPGLTGLWQVSGRGEVGYADRVGMDKVYCLEWSLKGDILILFKTVAVLIQRKGAY